MPKQILFVQGAGESAHDRWDNKLVENLRHELGEDYLIYYPHMPGEEALQYKIWKAALLEAFKNLRDGVILIGHSVGGTVLLHVLTEAWPDFTPAGLILIAPPFIGAGGWPCEDITARADFSRNLPMDLPVWLYHGNADTIVPVSHANLYAEVIPRATIYVLSQRDHQLNNDLSEVAENIRSVTR